MHLTDYIDLASERLGGRAIFANDEFFAPKEALLLAEGPVWKEGAYTERGKWMDGWETRRRRNHGHDWCVIRLGCPGVIKGFLIDTSYFTGNYPEHCSIEACTISGVLDLQEIGRAEWHELLPKEPLQGNTRNLFPIESDRRVTHLRLNIFPDGGVARLRAYGVVMPDWERLRRRGVVDLAAAERGGFVSACSDNHYGNRQSLIMPQNPSHMGDGWETRRRRKPGHEWALVRLGRRGVIRDIEIDTTHFKGNAPDRCTLELLDSADEEPGADAQWQTVLEHKLQPHTRHVFTLDDTAPATHARLNIFPDGGLGRLRLFGTADE